MDGDKSQSNPRIKKINPDFRELRMQAQIAEMLGQKSYWTDSYLKYMYVGRDNNWSN